MSSPGQSFASKLQELSLSHVKENREQGRKKNTMCLHSVILLHIKCVTLREKSLHRRPRKDKTAMLMGTTLRLFCLCDEYREYSWPQSLAV